MNKLALIHLINDPMTATVSKVILYCIFGFQINLLLFIALTNPEGTAAIVKAYRNPSELVK